MWVHEGKKIRKQCISRQHLPRQLYHSVECDLGLRMLYSLSTEQRVFILLDTISIYRESFRVVCANKICENHGVVQ